MKLLAQFFPVKTKIRNGDEKAEYDMIPAVIELGYRILDTTDT